jgi:hypothetical protein
MAAIGAGVGAVAICFVQAKLRIHVRYLESRSNRNIFSASLNAIISAVNRYMQWS